MTRAHLFADLLAEKHLLLADGAMGTTLFGLGLEGGGCPELLNVEQPDLIAEVHRRFVEAGSDIILTNTFGGNRRRLALHGLDSRVDELNIAAVQIARGVADESAGRVVVAGDVGPTGDLFAPLGPLTLGEGIEVFADQMGALAKGGADVLWVETLSSFDELNAAVEAASRFELPLVTTLSFDTNGRTMMGITPREFGEWWEARSFRPMALGANCGIGPGDAVGAAFDISAVAPEVVMVAKPNAGMPTFNETRLVYPLTPNDTGDFVEMAVRSGVRILGMCCGSTPDHIAAIRRALDGQDFAGRPERREIENQLGAHVIVDRSVPKDRRRPG